MGVNLNLQAMQHGCLSRTPVSKSRRRYQEILRFVVPLPAGKSRSRSVSFDCGFAHLDSLRLDLVSFVLFASFFVNFNLLRWRHSRSKIRWIRRQAKSKNHIPIPLHLEFANASHAEPE